MKVKVYELLNDHANLIECDLAECFDGSPDDLAEAKSALIKDGMFRVGGGAAPKFLLVRA